MSSPRIPRRTPSLSFTALLGITLALAFAATASAQVVSDPRIAEFDPSSDHSVVLSNGQPAVLRYDLAVYRVGVSAPFVTVDMGKPTPASDGKIRYDFSSRVPAWPLPGGNYEARVRAVGPSGEGVSAPSNAFTFTAVSTCTISLSSTTVSAWAPGGSYAVNVSTGAACAWTVTTALPWVRLVTTAGAGSGTVSFDVLINSSSSIRTGTIGIGSQTVVVLQAGAGAPGGDFSGDLKADVLFRHSTRGEVWLWSMDGSRRTTETYVSTVADTNWEIRSLGDQDGDGAPDLLWRNKTNGQVYFWPMDGATPRDEIYVGTVDPAFDIVGTGDFNGDGRSDILWRHATLGDVWVWLMDGSTRIGAALVGAVEPAYVVKGVGDVDGDAKADVVWTHATNGQVWIWLMDGVTRRTKTAIATVPDARYQIQAVADFNGDAKSDILWWHSTSGEVWIWTMNGLTRQAETWVATVPDTGYRIAGAGDYNGDAKTDILWRHASRGEVWVWLMNGTTKASENWVATVPSVDWQVVKAK